MGIDNPTYFTIPGGLNRGRRSLSLRHDTTAMGNSRSSVQHASTGSSSILDALVLGLPRARDVAPNPSSSTCRSSSDLLFQSTTSSSYYNLPTVTPSRRHSIGSYFIKNNKSTRNMFNARPSSSSFSHGDINMDDDNNAEDKIVIIRSNKSETAELWVTYLNTCLQQIRKNRKKTPYRIFSIAVEDIDGKDTLNMLNCKLDNAQLTMIIICPAYLRNATLYSQRTRAWTQHLNPNRVLAMLLGVEEKSLPDHQITSQIGFTRWKKMESVKDRDEKFVSDFLSAAMEILNRRTSSQSFEKSDHFMLVPKKANLCQRKVSIVLTEPLNKQDEVIVKLIREGQEMGVNVTSKRRHPCVRTFYVPDICLSTTSLVGVRVFRNGHELGVKQLKCESQLAAMEQLISACDHQPLDFTCQALKIVPADKEKLDEIFVKAFQRNIPPDFHLLQGAGLTDVVRGSVCEQYEYPTLLHVAARLGLQQLCWTLLECPGGDVACELRNNKQLTPAEIASNAGHTSLANALMGYLQMTQFSNAYAFLKGIVDNKSNEKQQIQENDAYMSPRPVMETYLVPPNPRPCLPPPPLGYMPMSPRTANIQQQNDEIPRALLANDIIRERLPNEMPRKKERESIEDELIEIINDFKNNILTMEEVETLVNQWWRRNHVQQSFREKQEYLAQLRQQYERVQQRMKEEMRATGRPSPLERIRNLFRSKPKTKETNDANVNLAANIRPSSSLSTASSTSSSSGRLSIDPFWQNNSYDIPPSPIQVANSIKPTLFIKEEEEEVEEQASNNVGVYVNIESSGTLKETF